MRVLVGACSSVVLALGPGSARAVDLIWDPGPTNTGTNGATPGGAGSWDALAASTTWFNGTADVAWPNVANQDVAVFGGTGAGVAVNRAATTNADGLRFTVGGYTLSPNAVATDTITFGGTNAIIIDSTASGDTTIATALVQNAASSFINNGVAGTGILQVTGGVTGAFTLTIDGTADTNINSVLGQAAGGLTKSGAATLTLQGAANTYTGATTVNGGTLILGKAAGANSVTGAVMTIAAGAKVQLTAANQIVDTNQLTLNGNAILDLNGNSETIARLISTSTTASVTLGSTGTFSFGDATTFTFAGVISGTGTAGITKVGGGGTAILTNINTYSGATNANPGILVFSGANGSAPSTSALGVGGNASITLDNSGAGNNNLDRIPDAAPVGLTGQNAGVGQVSLIGNATVNSSETLGTLTISNFQSALNVSNGTANTTTTTLTFGGYAARPVGAVLNVSASGGTLGGGTGNPNLVLTGATNTNGILGGYATVNGTDWATVGATNGIQAFPAASYVPLATATANDNAILAATATVASAQSVNTLKIAPGAAGQSLTLGADLTLTDGGLLYVGGGNNYTINGTGALVHPTEVIANVQANTLIIAAPINSPKLTKAGAGTLQIPVSGTAPTFFGTATNIAGTLDINAAASTTTTYTAVIQGNGLLQKSGPGTLVLSNTGNTYTGGTTINAGVLELQAAGAAPQSFTLNNAGTSLIGNQNATITLNGGTLKLTTKGTGSLTMGKTLTFGLNGGALEMVNDDATIGAVHGGHIAGGTIVLVTQAAATAPAVIRFNGGHLRQQDTAVASQYNWTSTNAVLFGSLASAAGPVRVELLTGASHRLGDGGTGTQTFATPYIVRGPAGGDPTSGAAGTVNIGNLRNPSTGHLIVDNSPLINANGGLFFENAVQVAEVGTTRAINANITVRGTVNSGGNPGYVTFSGRGTGTALGPTLQLAGATAGNVGQHVLYLGSNGSATPTLNGKDLTIEGGGVAVMDLRVRADQANHNAAAIDARTIINAGGTVRLNQSLSNFTPAGTDPVTGTANAGITAGNVGNVIWRGNIRGEGTTASESVMDILLPTAVNLATPAPHGGVDFQATVGLIVNGSGTGGLRVNGITRPNALFSGATADPITNDIKVNNLLTATRLAAITGTGGYLTPAPVGVAFSMPAAGEWGVGVPVGLKAVNSNASGTDVALTANFSHNIFVDTGATLSATGFVLGPAATTAGLGRTGGTGTIAGPVTINTGGTIAPGASPGTLSVTGDLTINGTLEAEVTGTAANQIDLLAVTGNLTLGGAAVLTDPGSTFDGASSYLIATYSGALTGTFVSTPNLPASYKVDYGTRNNSSITLVPVPEPSSIAAGLLGVAGLLGMRRRRAHRQ
jgi:autotransporter-associated beta strand protein